MTKVLFKQLRTLLALILCAATSGAYSAAAVDSATPASGPGESLYLQLEKVGLDPSRIFKVRDAAIERPSIHITLEDGTIGFTQDVMGRITGAFFEGDGEILLEPPNEVERKSLSLFTGSAIIEERFATAYFRFNDDVATELRPGLRAADNASDFAARRSETASNLAHSDAMRLLLTFSRLLPSPTQASPTEALDPGDHMLHARLQGLRLGIFDVYYDSSAGEQVEAGQAKTADNGDPFYDVWTSFTVPRRDKQPARTEVATEAESASHEDSLAIRHYSISTDVTPPKQIHGDARLQIEVRQGGPRTLIFELSRFLQLETVEMDGHPVEFIHNPAMEGTQLSRRGNDILAVILPAPAQTGQQFDLRFVYTGEVLAEAGGGLLYVGARGTWYPNRGLAMSDFDLKFRYPPGWTLLATGKPLPPSDDEKSKAQPNQISHWVSARPIPVAGFNLGKYKQARADAGGVLVEAYATTNVEKTFPTSSAAQILRPDLRLTPENPISPQRPPLAIPHRPSPASTEASVADAAAQAINYYAARFGPFPYSRLSLTQMPGQESQGWPGLVFLSSYAFLTNEERAQIHSDPVNVLLQQQIPAHEVAHQWWGDLVMWGSYRDQWFSEGLANYCSLMILQEKNPAGFRLVMERYRHDLLEKNKEGLLVKEDGPVSLGTRLLSSRFPEGYEAISYGRGTWLFYMLRTMLQDGAAETKHNRTAHRGASDADDPFMLALHKIRDRYQGKTVSTAQLFDVFAENLPPSLRYEGKSSLQWFVDGWVNGTTLPKIELKAVKFVPRGNAVIVTGSLVQKDAPPELVTSVPIYMHLPNRAPALLGRVFADGEESSFRLIVPPGTHQIILDPNETVLTSPK